MIVLLQRVAEASVVVDSRSVAEIGQGLLVFVAVEPDDDEAVCERIAERVTGYRIFTDAQGRMNLNVRKIDGELLLVPQFTLAADTHRGLRPSFSTVAAPQYAEHRFDSLAAHIRQRYPQVQVGRFGADMKVHLINDGPVTFLLRT